MIIDEISMVSLQTLSTINDRCKAARCLNPESPDLFGAAPLVIFLGDFYQFPPVKGLPLWKTPRKNNPNEITGQEI
jgi:ATP-dependent DNA helicase PIF1